MKKALVITLLALLAVNLAIFGYFFWQRSRTEEDFATLTEKSSPSSVPVSGPASSPNVSAEMTTPLADLNLAPPVEKSFLEGAIIDKETSQAISFYLPPQEPIRAIFSGRVKQVFLNQKPFPNDLAFQEIRLEREDGQFWSSYILVGEVLVQEGEEVLVGDILAKAEEGGLGFRAGTNFSLWLHDKNDQMVTLSKDIF
jgi:hypothetical protein